MSYKDQIKRTEALMWWRSLSSYSKERYARKYFDRNHESLTGREIQMMHENNVRPKMIY